MTFVMPVALTFNNLSTYACTDGSYRSRHFAYCAFAYVVPAGVFDSRK